MFVHPIEPFAREAFAAGWASTGGPMTKRVRSACTVAVRLAVENADDPQILEATLQFGKLEGLWAELFKRRDELTAEHTDRIAGLWRKALTREILRDAARKARGRPVGEATDPTDQDVAAATAAVTAILAALPQRSEWTALRQALRDAIAAGHAEGTASAAASASGDGSDWDAAFQAAYDALDGDHALWDQADTWLRRLIARATSQLAQALAVAVAAGGSEDEQTDALDAEVDNGDAPGFTTDWAMGSALGAGMLAWYQQQGQQLVSWVTAGDGRVCPVCEDNETNSPYPLDSFPEIPAHPRCRCVATI